MRGPSLFVLGGAVICFALIGSGQTTAELKEQAAKDYAQADAALNKVYGELRDALDDAEKEQLKQVQRIWLQYRDAAAKFESSRYAGGTLEGMVHTNALTTLTEQRVQSLKNCFIEGYTEAEEATPAVPSPTE